MTGHRSFLSGLLVALFAACSVGGGDGAPELDAPPPDEVATHRSGWLSAASCDVEEPAALMVCSGDFDVLSSCFIDLGGGRVRKETAQTFVAEMAGPPGKLRTVLSLRNHPSPPPPGQIWEIEADIRPLDEDGKIPLDTTNSIAAAYLKVRSCDAEGAIPGRCLDYREDLQVEMTFTWEDNMYPGQAYAVVLSVLEPADLIIGIACHSEGDVYPDGNAWYRTTRLILDDGTVREFTDTPFIPYARDLSFAITINDGCLAGDQPSCGIGECRTTVPWCMDGDPIACEDFIPEPGVEACNGLDEDCDGIVDNLVTNSHEKLQKACYTGPDGTRAVGVCADGYEECDAAVGSGVESWDGICRGQILPSAETCDGRDEDCDGFIDNAATGDPARITTHCYTGPEGTEDVGACHGGLRTCNAQDPGGETWGSCVGEVVPQLEICDGIDNDCDGEVDEGNPGDGEGIEGGAACVVPGKFGQCAIGTWQCQEGGLVCVSLYEPSAEVCDGLDNDCDGFVDNTGDGIDNKLIATCYDGPEGSAGVGICRTGVTTCNATEPGVESWGACVGQQLPEAEICDGLDNDCDGFRDNSEANEDVRLTQDCYTGPEGTRGVGICHGGTATCVATADSGIPAWSACDGEQVPEADVCDGLDNDCDGFFDNVPGVDEKLKVSCYEGPAGTEGVGICHGGQKECQSPEGAEEAFFGACDGQQLPGAEICDGLDNNCDGHLDNANYGQPEKIVQSCYEGPEGTRNEGICSDGWQYCEAAAAGVPAWGTCFDQTQPGVEVCDGLDNNCDGAVDEGNPGGGGTCNTGQQGACGPGVYACVAGSVVCVPDQATPAEEICDGIDNDCDGIVDNIPGTANALERSCYSGPGGTENVGVCTGGVNRCIDGAWDGVCVGEVTPSAEVCDGLDNDCDGTVDHIVESCYTGEPGTEGVGECKAGTTTCINASWGSCTGQVLPGDEICDGLDNNCDGGVDEHANLVQIECEKQQGVCSGALRPKDRCVAGSWQACTNADYTAHNPAYHPTAEICDGLDNNCNGTADEVNYQGSRVLELAYCEKDKGVCLTAGGQRITKPTNLCQGAAGWAACGDSLYSTNASSQGKTYHPTQEVCDGEDNNCNGSTDEHANLQLVNCEMTQGVCSGAKKPPSLCVNGAWGACTQAHYTSHSSFFRPVEGNNDCDGRDNDCDGFVDNATPFSSAKLNRSCYGGPEGTAGVGECRSGNQTCNATVAGTESWTSCAGEVLPSTEVCDGKDNNCNGQVDGADPAMVIPNCEKQNGVCSGAKKPVALCQGSSGWGACNDGHYSTHASSQGKTYHPTQEVCDNQDNNCNGQVDEHGTLQQIACQNPVGAASPLKGVCAGALRPKDRCVAGVWQACTTADFQLHSSRYRTSETVNECDGYDNDCDGNVDNQTQGSATKLGQACYGGPAGTRNKGVCTDGAQSCNAAPNSGVASWTTCTGWTGPSAEVCDGRDNDCDGYRDNNSGSNAHNTLTATCYDGPAGSAGRGPCRTGTKTCTSTTAGVETWGSCVGQVLPATEVCDGIDNNCDGSVDNNSNWRQLCPALDNARVASAACNSAAKQCYATTCSSTYYYAGTSIATSNDCACIDDDGYSGTCGTATSVGTMSVTSNELTRAGKVAIPTGGVAQATGGTSNSDYFVANYTVSHDSSTRLRGTPRVRLTSNPGNAFRIRVRQANAANACAGGLQRCNAIKGVQNVRNWTTTGTTLAENITAWTHSDNCKRGNTNCKSIGYRTSANDTRPGSGSNWPIGVEVYRTASTSACEGYTVVFDYLESSDPSEAPALTCGSAGASWMINTAGTLTSTLGRGTYLRSPKYNNTLNQRINKVNNVPLAPGADFAHYASEHWYRVLFSAELLGNRTVYAGNITAQFTTNTNNAYRFAVYGVPGGNANCSSLWPVTECSSATSFTQNCALANGCATGTRMQPISLYFKVFRAADVATPAQSRQLYEFRVTRN